MKILNTVSTLGIKSGGPSQSIYSMVKGLNNVKCDSHILTMNVKNAMTDNLSGENEFIKALPFDAITPLAISRTMRDYLFNNNYYDLYQTHGLWLDINHATCANARKKRKPYIITPRGMLYPQALRRSAWKKKFLFQLWYKKDLSEATCIHATCIQEMEYYRQLGFINPVAVIPNPIDIPAYVDDIRRPNDRFRIGFLGRLHPRKRVHDLIAAWKNAGQFIADGELLIIGEGDSEYMTQLHDQVRHLGLHNVTFAGFLSGRAKFEALASLTALFVPSDFENFGMIVPEALIVGTPVMASFGTPWEELDSYGCGWWRDNSIQSLTECLENVSNLSSDQLLEMGKRGRELIEGNYSSSMISGQMMSLYSRILGDGKALSYYYE